MKHHGERTAILLQLLDRLPGVCVIETDSHGVLTHFGPGAEAFFGCPAEEALGKLHYGDFHDPDELAACHGSPEFKAAMKSPGWSEDIWRVVPRTGDPFPARVTLVPLHGDLAETGANADKIEGWLALYRRVEGA